MSPVDDARLVEACRNGRPELFSELVDRHAAAVFRIVRAGVRQQADAEDLAQEAFLASFRSLRRLRDPRRFRAHLLTIAARKVADHLRRRRRRGEPLPLADEPPAPAAAPGRSLLDAVHELVEELPPETRLILALRHHEGLSARQIARLLDVAEGTVYSRLSRTHAAIRRAMEVREP